MRHVIVSVNFCFGGPDRLFPGEVGLSAAQGDACLRSPLPSY